MVVDLSYTNGQTEGCAAKLQKEVRDVAIKEGEAELWCKRITGETCWSQTRLIGGAMFKGGLLTDVRAPKVKGCP